MMKTLINIKIILVLILATSLTGCVLPKSSLENLSQLAPEEIIFVGRVMMNPPMTEDDVQLENFINLSDTPIHKSLQMKVSEVYYELGGQLAHDYQDSIFTIDGEYYSFAWEKNKPMNILGITFITRSTQTNRDTMTFSIDKGVRVKYSGKTRVVYVGDITFVRDEFFNIKDIDINQKNYKKAVKAFRKKYKTKWKVEKGKLISSK